MGLSVSFIPILLLRTCSSVLRIVITTLTSPPPVTPLSISLDFPANPWEQTKWTDPRFLNFPGKDLKVLRSETRSFQYERELRRYTPKFREKPQLFVMYPNPDYKGHLERFRGRSGNPIDPVPLYPRAQSNPNENFSGKLWVTFKFSTHYSSSFHMFI